MQPKTQKQQELLMAVVQHAGNSRHSLIDQLQMEEAETEVPFPWKEEAMTRWQAGAGILKRRTEA